MTDTSSKPLTTKRGFTVGHAVVIGTRITGTLLGYQMRLRMTPAMSRAS